MKVAYRPSGSFSLRDFHHAVNNLPIDAFLPELNKNVAVPFSDVHLPSVLSDKVLYSWGGDNTDVGRKLIVISSCLLENLDSVTKKTLMDAADKCVSVEFVLLEQVSNGLGDLSESMNNFVNNISDLENCSLRKRLPKAKVLCGLVKEWLLDLRNESEQLHARLNFKKNAFGSLNQICCNLFSSFNHIIDEFEPCQENMKVARKGDMGFAPLYAENLDPSTTSKGDLKETFHIGEVYGFGSGKHARTCGREKGKKKQGTSNETEKQNTSNETAVNNP